MAQPSHQLRRKNLISPEMGGGEKKEINTMCRKVVSCESQVTVSILSSTVSDHFFFLKYTRGKGHSHAPRSRTAVCYIPVKNRRPSYEPGVNLSLGFL